MSLIENAPYRSAPLRDDSSDRTPCLEVIARWNDDVLAVAHLRPGERFVLASRADGHPRGTHALVHPSVGARPWTLAEHAPDGRCTAWRHPDATANTDTSVVALTDDTVFAQSVGGVILSARRVLTSDEATPRRLIDRRNLIVLAIAACLLGAVIACAGALHLPPFGGSPDLTLLNRAQRDDRYLRALMARWPSEVDPSPAEIRRGWSPPREVINSFFRPPWPMSTLSFASDTVAVCETFAHETWRLDRELSSLVWQAMASYRSLGSFRVHGEVSRSGRLLSLELSDVGWRAPHAIEGLSSVRLRPSPVDRPFHCTVTQGPL